MSKKNWLRILMVFVCLMLVCTCVPAEDCAHPEEKREVFDWFNESFEFTDNGDGKTHKAVYSGVTEVWDCAACGRRGQSAADDKIFEAEPHAFTGGVCDCGAEDTFCEHTNRVWQHEGRKNAEYTYYDKTNHKSSYIALDVYECQDCGCWFDIEAGQKVILEEHMLKGETECAYCGEFGDIYTLSFQFVGEDAGEGYSRNVKAGDVAKLPILVGEVFENEGNPKRFKSWTENVPDGAEPVQFIIAEPNEWGAREYSFIMPERDVTVIGEWEKVYAVVYHDGVDDVEIFADEWHTCSYGEATPAFEAVDKLVREGYVFTGWDPAVAETVTERADYYAQWEICEHENFEYTENWEASGYQGWAEKIEGNDYKHTALYTKHHEAKCLDCGALFSHVYEEGAEEADHVYDADGKCTQCAYACSHADKTNGVCDACGTEIFCEHQNKTEVETGVYKLASDSQWTPDNEGYHVGMAQIGTLYHCGECNSNLFVPLEDVKEYRFKCEQDENEDGLCDVCSGKMPDTTAPKFQFVGLEPPTGVVGCEVKVIAQFTDETELGCYKLYINDVLTDEGELSGLTGEMAFTTTELAVGEHYFKLEVYDAADNCSKYPWPNPVTITAANTAPVVGDITSTAGETFHIGTEVTFSADVTDDYGLTKVELYIDNEIKESVETTDLQSAIEFATSELTVGEHVVRVVATDSDNLTAEKSLTVTVYCDHVSKTPTGNVTETPKNYESIDDYQHTKHYTEHVEVKCDACGEVSSVDEDKSAVQNHDYSSMDGICANCEHECSHPLDKWDEGACRVCEKTIWDTVPPTVDSVTIEPLTGRAGTKVTYRAEVSDDRKLDWYEIHINGEFVTEGYVYGTEDVIEFSTTELDVGEHYFKLRLWDYSHEVVHEYSEPVIILPPNTAPEISELTCSAGEEFPVDTDEVTFCVTVTDDYKLAKVELYVDDGLEWDVMTGDPLCKFTTPPAALKIGEHVVRVVATDAEGLTTEKSLTVTVFCEHEFGDDHICDICGYGKLTITRQPENTWAYVGENAMFTVEAVGDELTYTWYYKNASASKYSESTIKEASIGVQMTEARDGRQMYCVVKDKYGNTVKTDTVTMTLRTKLEITKQPTDDWAYDGEKATTSVTATGDDLRYEWYYRNAGDSEFTKSTTTAATYSLTMNEERDGREVYCIVYDGYDQYVQSDTVTLDTRFKPVIITQPVSTWAYYGENVAVGIEATGDGLTYTWYYKNASSSSFKESSLTTPIYAVKAAENTDGRQLYCIVTDAYGNTAKSDTVTLDTRYVVDITQQPQSVTASAGETVTFTVKATGDGLTYQWQYRNAGVEDWTDSTNTKASYATELKEARNGREVRCIVKDAYGNIEISEAATMKLTMVQITKQPVDAWAYEDEKATVSVAATGDDLRYEWYYRNAGDSEFTKSTTTSATYSLTMSEARDGREVYCIVYDGYDQYVQSDTVTLVTKYKPTITEQPTSVTASAEQDITFTIKAEGEEPLSYQWYYRNAGTTAWKEGASTETSYTTTMKAERDGREIYCKVTDTNGASVSSKTVTMNLPAVKITDNPNDVTASAEENVTFSVAATGDGPLTYQWYYRNAGTTTWKEGASTEASYTTTMKAERDGREVYCEVTDVYGQTAKSGTATMNLPEVRITKDPSDATAPAEQNVTFRVEAEGDGPLTYQWYYRNAGTTTWKEASSTEATYTTMVKEERDGREVYCKVTDAYGQTAKSATAKMILEVVKTPLEITSHPKDATVAAGNTAKFTVAAQGDGLTYQWEYKKPGSDTWTESSTGTTATYSFTMKDTYDGRQIRCIITDKYDDTVISNAADLTLAPPPIKITNQPDDAVVSAGDTAKFTVAAEGNDLTYQWQYKKSGSSTWSTASSTSTTYSFTMKDTYDDRSIRCVITDGDGNTVTSNTASLNLPVVTITSQPKSASVAVGDKATFTIKATGDGLEYQWQYKKSGSSTWSTASSTSTTYSFTMKESYDDRSIRCKVKDAYGNTVTSSSVKLTLE